MTHHDEHDDNHDRGLAYDVNTLMTRRRALGMIAGAAGAVVLAGCGVASKSSGSTTSTTAASTGRSTTTIAAPAASIAGTIPTETAGPYPGDGSNGPDILTQSGIVRSDIRSSFGTGSATAAGVPLTINLKVLDNANGNLPLAGAAVYLWHCDRSGKYSMYSSGLSNENYLRGVQETDANGNVTFTSIFPAAYSGRWPHVHFEVYKDLATATSSGPIRKTSQLALPQDVCKTVYASAGYEASVRNLASTSLATDNVFRDDSAATQLATVAGSVASGYTASLNVPV